MSTISADSEKPRSPLSEDWLTAWSPDIGANFDAELFMSRPMEGERPLVQWLRLPKPNGQRVLMPVLHPATHASLHRATEPLRNHADEMLAEGVFGYRRGAVSSASYSEEWQRFTAYTKAQAADAETVLFADIRNFFPSTPWPVVANALRVFLPRPEAKQLSSLIRIWQDRGLRYLPPGYADARLLANIVLHHVDSFLDVPFARWVDDYRIFLPTGHSPESAQGSLEKLLARVELMLNPSKTRIVPAAEVVVTHRNALGDAYDPERDGPEAAREALQGLLAQAAADPVGERRTLRFVLGRLTKTRDDSAIDFALDRLADCPWEAPRLVSYLALFSDNSEVAARLDKKLGEAILDDDEWLICRLGPALMRGGLSEERARQLDGAIDRFASSPAWGVSLRLLALAGEKEAVMRATYDNVPDSRAALIALADLEVALPERLAKLEPLTAGALAGSKAPLPGLASLL